MKNWKTTVGGLLASAGAAMALMPNPTCHLIGGVATSLGALLLGLSAKDHNVSGK